MRSPLVYLTVLVVATCGLVYELVAGTLASYVLGDSVTQFSTVIGGYPSAPRPRARLSRGAPPGPPPRLPEGVPAGGPPGGGPPPPPLPSLAPPPPSFPPRVHP